MITATSSDEHSFISHVGSGSSPHDLHGESAINVETSEALTPVKLVNLAPPKAVSSLNAAAIAYEQSPLR